MRHLIEFMICGTIGAYCLVRCASLMPRVLSEVQAVVRAAAERRRVIEDVEAEY